MERKQCLLVGLLAWALVAGCTDGDTTGGRDDGAPTAQTVGPGGAGTADPEQTTATAEANVDQDATQPRTTEIPAAQADVPQAASNLNPTGYTIEEFYRDYYGATNIVNTWWATHWNEYFTGTYTTPKFISGGAYGTGLYDAPREQYKCGNTVLQEGNAYYCPPVGNPNTDWLAFEFDFLLQARTLGDAFVYMIVAHEWGHAVAARLRQDLNFPAQELQADCLGGAALRGAIQDGTLAWETGDDQEVVAGLDYVAGKGLPWGTKYIDAQGNTQTSTHGSPQERRNNFFRGVTGGVRACLPQAE